MKCDDNELCSKSKAQRKTTKKKSRASPGLYKNKRQDQVSYKVYYKTNIHLENLNSFFFYMRDDCAICKCNKASRKNEN